jgi:hypothetical protein
VRAVLPEVDDIAVRVVAEEVSLVVTVQQPRTLYVMGNGLAGNLRVFDSVDRTTVLAGSLVVAARFGAAVRPTGLTEVPHVAALQHCIEPVTLRIVNVQRFLGGWRNKGGDSLWSDSDRKTTRELFLPRLQCV